MAPMKVVAKRKRTAPSTSVHERRSKQREEAPPPPQREPTPPEEEEIPVPKQIIPMGTRPVASGRKINLNFLQEENFIIGEWLQKQQWEYFCGLDIPIYPVLVKTFFENMRFEAEGVKSEVKNVEIFLDENSLGYILHLPVEGEKYLTTKNRPEALRLVLEKRNVKGVTTVRANQLSLELRLLHNMVCWIFLPRTGRFDYITERDLMFMKCLIKGNQINLPFIMITQMKNAARKARACLPYGMAFTLVFEHFGVDLEGEERRSLLHTDKYSTKSFARMGYNKVEGRWIKKTSGQIAAHSDSDSESDDDSAGTAPIGEETSQPDIAGPSQPAPCTPPRTDPTEQQQQQHTDFSVRQEMAALRAEISGLRADQQTLHSRVESLQTELRDGLSQILTAIRQTSFTPSGPSRPPSHSPPPPEHHSTDTDTDDDDDDDGTPVTESTRVQTEQTSPAPTEILSATSTLVLSDIQQTPQLSAPPTEIHIHSGSTEPTSIPRSSRPRAVRGKAPKAPVHRDWFFPSAPFIHITPSARTLNRRRPSLRLPLHLQGLEALPPRAQVIARGVQLHLLVLLLHHRHRHHHLFTTAFVIDLPKGF